MDLPFISLDYGYFLNISASLGADEAGAWLMLYSQAWGRGGSLQDDDDRLCRLCRLTTVSYPPMTLPTITHV